jgi:hypothetical protein
MPTYTLAAVPPGVDWIAVVRWITIAYGALAVLAIMVIGLMVRHITVTAIDANTGRVIHDTLDIGAAAVIVAVVVAAVFALFAWLTQFMVMRAIMLFLVGAGALGAISRIADGSTAVVFASLGSLVVDAGFCFVLLMSLLARPRPSY